MERRTFIGALSGTSLGILLKDSFVEFAREQNTAQAGASVAAQGPFETSQVEVSGNTVFVRRYGKGPAILMVHGFPRTSLMWRSLAPKLADNHTVICVDLLAYGRSGTPPSTGDHFPYSKRAMARELVDVMVKLGFSTFTLIGHDRGGRVSYRLALDHPNNVEGGPLGIWRQWAPHAQGQAMKGGHFFPEENPDDTAVLVKQFLSA
jgi:haloacetate dehalogenase